MTDPQAPIPVAHRAAQEHLERLHARRQAALTHTARFTPNVPENAPGAPPAPPTEGKR